MRLEAGGDARKRRSRTDVAIVGTRATCQLMRVLISVAPAISTARLRNDFVPLEAAVDEVDHRQATDEDEVGPQASRMRRTVPTAKRM